METKPDEVVVRVIKFPKLCPKCGQATGTYNGKPLCPNYECRRKS